MSLHWVDKQKKEWTDNELDKMFIFCMLDRAMPYEKVCNAFNCLDTFGLTIRRHLRDTTEENLVDLLKSTGFRFPNQTAKFLKEFSVNPIDLRTASRDEIVKNVKGIGYKLASMFLRNTRGINYAVIDVHIKNYMSELGYDINKSYKELEKDFYNVAKELNLDPYTLDMEIWQNRRIGNR